MTDMDDYLARKRVELGMGREEELRQIQVVLDRWYPNMVRAKRLHEGVLTLVVSGSSLANELYLRQTEFVDRINQPHVTLRIMIRK